MIELLGYFGAMMIGVSLGMLGGGGSILAVPLFVYFFSLQPTLATSYSLFVVGLVSLVGGFKAWSRDQVHLRAGFLFAVPSFIGVILVRRWVLPSLPSVLSIFGFDMAKETLVLVAFAVVMLLASVSMLRLKKEEVKRKPSSSEFFFKALLVGGVTGFVGAGGGFLIVPALVAIGGLPMKVAIGTSLGVIAVNSLLGFVGDVVGGVPLDGFFLLKISVLSMLGLLVGSYWGQKTSDAVLKPLFGGFVLVLGLLIILQQIF